MRLLRVGGLLALLVSLSACASEEPFVSRYVNRVNSSTTTQAQQQSGAGSMFDTAPFPGAGGRLEPLPKQDWTMFPWVERSRQRPSAYPAGNTTATDSDITIIKSQDGQFVEVARYSQPGGEAGNLPIDPRQLDDSEARIVITRGVLIAGVNRSNAEYVLNLKSQLQSIQEPVVWLLVGPGAKPLERGMHRPTDAGFCGSLRTGTACLWFDGKMQVIQTDMLS